MFEWHDLLVVLVLIFLEGLLSADNAVLLAVLVLPLPEDQQGKALRYGIIGAIVFRLLAIIFARQLLHYTLFILVGGLYLLYLSLKHFIQKYRAAAAYEPELEEPKVFRRLLGLSPFWSTVIVVELTDIVFAVDSILVAVAMSNKFWVIFTGGVLGLIAMRFVAQGFLGLIKKYPTIIDGAYVIVGWVSIKLIVEYFHKIQVIDFEIPKWVTLLAIFLIFVGSMVMDKRKARVRTLRMDGQANTNEGLT